MLIFARGSTDGYDEFSVCVDGRHWRFMGYDDMDGISPATLRGPCDGSCELAKVVNVQEWIRETSGKLAPGADGMASRIVVGDEVSALLGEAPLEGKLVYHWYCKRDSTGDVIQIADVRYMALWCDFDSWSGDNTGYVNTYRVELLEENRYESVHFTTDEIMEIISRSEIVD